MAEVPPQIERLDPAFLDRLRGAAAELRTNIGRVAAAGLLVMAGSVTAFTAGEVGHPDAAYADTLGYPWADAPCEFGAAGGAQCQNTDPLKTWDKYDWYLDKDGDGVFGSSSNRTGCGATSGASGECWDQWGYEFRNCTSYVAWKESQWGVADNKLTGLHNGGQWYDYAPSSERSTTPRAGDAAVVPGNPGHVAFVESVNSDGSITVSEYNHDTHGNGGTRTGTASSMGFTEFVDFGATAPSGGGSSPSNTTLQMILDGSGQVWARNTATLGMDWTQETPTGETKIAAGSNGMQMILDGSGQVWARNSSSLNSSWTQESSGGITAIAAGANGQQMILDGQGQVWATGSIAPNQWTRETPPGIVAIAMGDNNLQMILDSSGQVWARNSPIFGMDWVQETPAGHTAIAAGDNGLQMILDAQGQVWATGSVAANQWSRETPPGITKISAGNNHLQVILDNTGQVWARNGTIFGMDWVRESSTGITAIAAGDNGQQVILDGTGQVWATDHIATDQWTRETPAGETAIAAGS
ncbi:MAG TPA: CHAP domain-containing protein [Bacillota bacterium]|nr:CHAP domain-containing protein [Bacillota bacterium]